MNEMNKCNIKGRNPCIQLSHSFVVDLCFPVHWKIMPNISNVLTLVLCVSQSNFAKPAKQNISIMLKNLFLYNSLTFKCCMTSVFL